MKGLICIVEKGVIQKLRGQDIPIRYREFYYVEIVLEFSNLLYGDFSQCLEFPIHASGPLAWIGKIQGTGSLINILQLFLFPDLNIFVK